MGHIIKKINIPYFKQSIRLVGLLTIILTFNISCWHKTKSEKLHNKPNIDYHTLFRKTQGTWISYEYILNLKKTNSPSESSPFMEGIISFTIDSSRLLNDTLHCISWVSGHQERDLWVAFGAEDSLPFHNVGINRSSEQSGTMPNENYTKIKIDSPFLTIYTSLFDSVRYVYFGELPKNTSSDFALKYYTTAALFHGNYYTPDSNTIFGSSHITFAPDEIGKIYGSPMYDSFDINVNAISQNDSTDYMELFDSKNQNESRSFTYKIKNKTLLIYPNINAPPCRLYNIESETEDTLRRKSSPKGIF